MENILRAGKTGTVKSISAAQGESLSVDQVILELDHRSTVVRCCLEVKKQSDRLKEFISANIYPRTLSRILADKRIVG